MKQLTIHIPEKKYQFVLELLSSLGFIKIDKPEESFTLSDKQRQDVEEEIKKAEEDPNYLLDWDDVKHQLNED